MKLIFIYGAPAVGKLTVARELSKITGFKLFHNHLTIDLARTAFEFDTPPFWNFVGRLRLEVLENAGKNQVKGIIMTSGYGRKKDGNTKVEDEAVKEILKTVEKYGEVDFVHLKCDEKTLFKRVKHHKRGDYQKILNEKTLKELLQKYNYTKIPFVESLEIDNSKQTAKKTAELIKGHYKL